MPVRRFPPPWTAEVTPNCFIVRDANGQVLSYVYVERSRAGERRQLLSNDECSRTRTFKRLTRHYARQSV